jgi:integrase
VTALKVVYRRELEDDELTVNPTLNLRLPEVEGEREWDANPEEAFALLETLGAEKALYATALLAGLRRGELKALRVCDLHGLEAEAGERFISVERGWDDREGPVAPKSKAGTRLTLLCETLRAILAEHIERTGRHGSELVFGMTATAPFVDWTVAAHASEAWASAAVGAFLRGESVSLERVTLHQCRHGFDSFLDAAGISEARADRSASLSGTG